VKFANKENKEDYVWATSWGVSTRLMGALIMMHSDDSGLVLPPRLAPFQVVFVPIYRNDEQKNAVLAKIDEIAAQLKAKGIRVKIDDDDTKKPGWKFAEWELKGVPVRLGLGMRDLENGKIEVARRDLLSKEVVDLTDDFADHISDLLEEIQQSIFQKAKAFQEANTRKVDAWEEFKAALEDDIPGFLYAHWDGTTETEEKIQSETKATIRCIPVDNPQEEGVCVYSGKPSKERVMFAKAY
jgi:prolyl-tRNA synthetase